MEIETSTTKEPEEFSPPKVSLLQTEEEEIEEMYAGVGDKEVFSTPVGRSAVSEGEVEETAAAGEAGEKEVVEEMKEEKKDEAVVSDKEEEEELAVVSEGEKGDSD